tara:strand:+ start:555 stop:1355 length:801 start_codon:yes stop_codon:yes gene_type:complete
MTTTVRPILIDLIILASFIKMMQYNIKMSTNYFKYRYNPQIHNRMTLLYVLIYTVYIIGIKPGRYLNILKIIYKLFNVFTKLITDKNNIVMIAMVINLFISIIILIISKTGKLTKNIMIALGLLTVVQILCRIVWGYNMINKRILTNANYNKRSENLKAGDLVIEKIANQDYDKLYLILKKLDTNFEKISKLSPEKRNAYIIQELMKLDLSKIHLKDEIVQKIQQEFNLEKDQLQNSITNLNEKINNLQKYQESTKGLMNCVAKYT